MYRLFSLFFALIFLFTVPANAQFKKGMRMAGASIGGAFFNAGSTDYTAPFPTTGYTSKTNSIGLNLAPDFGWFISDKTVIGGQFLLSYKYDKDLLVDADNITYSKNILHGLHIGLGAFARQYFSATGSFYPFAQVNLQALTGSSKNDGFFYNSSPLYKDVFKGKSSGDFTANAGFALGVTKMINTYVGLDISVGYTYSYNKNKYKTNTARDADIDGTIDERPVSDITTKSTSNGIALNVGFQIFLGNDK
jgi:hypothetical protein